MREKGVVLEYHGYAAVSAGNVVDYLSSHMQGAGGDILQTGDHAQGGGFSAAGRAQQNQPLPSRISIFRSLTITFFRMLLRRVQKRYYS